MSECDDLRAVLTEVYIELHSFGHDLWMGDEWDRRAEAALGGIPVDSPNHPGYEDR